MALEAAPLLSQPQAHRGNYLLSINLCSSVLSHLQTQVVLPRCLLAVWTDPLSGGGGLGAHAETSQELGTQETPSITGGTGDPAACAVTS